MLVFEQISYLFLINQTQSRVQPYAPHKINRLQLFSFSLAPMTLLANMSSPILITVLFSDGFLFYFVSGVISFVDNQLNLSLFVHALVNCLTHRHRLLSTISVAQKNY